MTLIDFCNNRLQILTEQPSVILFSSKQYSPLSFAKILKWLSLPSLQKLDLDQDMDQLSMKLHTTFLGQTCTFWFGDLALIPAKKKRTDWLQFLQTYQGPHEIIGWLGVDDVCKPTSKNGLIIEVPEQISSETIHKLSFLYQDHKPEISAYFFGRLYRMHKEFTLEQLCLLANYAGLMGKNMDSFFDTWLEQLIVLDVSLFYLAQLFFEKKADLFFEQWHQVRDYYPDQFWCVFFSEQLFKAYFYSKAHGRVDASSKQMTYGLPFSFLKHDWKLYKPENLQQAHELLYDVDIALKTGGSFYCLDGFLAKFFA
jgi:hypothetical protein